MSPGLVIGLVAAVCLWCVVYMYRTAEEVQENYEDWPPALIKGGEETKQAG